MHTDLSILIFLGVIASFTAGEGPEIKFRQLLGEGEQFPTYALSFQHGQPLEELGKIKPPEPGNNTPPRAGYHIC